MTGTTMGVSGAYFGYGSYQTTVKKTEKENFTNEVKNKSGQMETSKSERGKVMGEYYARKPQYKDVQEKRVKGGYSVLSQAGVSAEDLENMSMAEFKAFMSKTIAGIPHDVTRPYDEETVLISEEGWENMKKDPDYAAWVVGYLKEDRSVKNPFLAMGDKGAYTIQSFGASPADYKGHSFSKIYGGTAAGARSMYNMECGTGGIVTRAPHADAQPPADYNLWEERKKARREKEKELLEADIQAKYEQRKRLDALYEKKYLQNQDMLRALNARRISQTDGLSGGTGISAAIGADIYEAGSSIMEATNLFSSGA